MNKASIAGGGPQKNIARIVQVSRLYFRNQVGAKRTKVFAEQKIADPPIGDADRFGQDVAKSGGGEFVWRLVDNGRNGHDD